MKKLYEVSCPAFLTYHIMADNKQNAINEAKSEFQSYLKYLSKAVEGACVVSSLNRLTAIDISDD
ncbi:MAG: hypothetical protein Q7R56_01755 [Nanoarchaeota archaeon]|nr:hypothetical protein [Nanoarchaeota archaeon]